MAFRENFRKKFIKLLQENLCPHPIFSREGVAIKFSFRILESVHTKQCTQQHTPPETFTKVLTQQLSFRISHSHSKIDMMNMKCMTGVCGRFLLKKT